VTQRRQKSPNSVQKVPKTAFTSELIRFKKIGIVLTVLLNKNCGQIIGQFLDFKISLKRQKFAQSGHSGRGRYLYFCFVVEFACNKYAYDLGVFQP
jgi:hypothetical protein